MRRNLYISGGLHLAVILWAIFGNVFRPDPPQVETSAVTVISEAEFAALTRAAQSPETAQEIDAPPAPEPDARPAARPEPAEPEPAPNPEPPAPTPEPEPEPMPEPVAPPAPVTPPDSTLPEAPPTPEASAPPPVLAPERAERPVPRPAPRVAPEPVAPPEPDTNVAEEVQQAAEAESEAAEVVEEEQEATAPEEVATEIVTEAEEPAAAEEPAPPAPTLAPDASRRPLTRPTQLAQRPEPEPEPEAPAPAETPAEKPAETPRTETAQTETPEPAAPEPAEDAVADAIAQALAAGGAAEERGPAGPPLTQGERESLRVAVQKCWVVDVGSQAANVTVTVSMDMEPGGRVVSSSLRMIGSSGGDASAAETAFQNARRAILRCQADGYPLPADKYDQWKTIEMTFNPEQMRLR
ncbi:cell envelope biogenesis protein TolA [Alloyangia pacifica]|uniref:cell envelope biogenesis protein TolA n=1 Tax=Alloyangia pacifica TaxID=311180 RepID=UPI0031E209C6